MSEEEQIEEILEEANAYNLRPEVEAAAKKIFKENDMFSKLDAYVSAYHQIIDDQMEEIQSQLETLIDDIERDETMTNTDIVLALYKLKEEIEDYNLGRDEGRTLEWDDLD